MTTVMENICMMAFVCKCACMHVRLQKLRGCVNEEMCACVTDYVQ